MLTRKVVVENIEDLNEEEDEHARLMKLQDRYEKSQCKICQILMMMSIHE